MQGSLIFWALMALYCMVIIGVAVYFAKFIRNADDFFGASRATPWWAAGLSYFMTAFSASAFVASASFTYRFGGLSVMSVVLAVFIFLAGFFIFSKLWHRTGCKTAVEYLQLRFGHRAAKFFVATGIPIRVLDNANRIYVTSVLMVALLGLPLWVGAVLTTAVAFASAIAGGFMSVVATDAIQAIVLGVLTLIIATFALIAVGGPGELLAKLPEHYWSLNPPSGEFDFPFIAAMALVGIFSWNGYWSLVQRFVSVKTERDARLVSLTSGFSYYLLFPLFTLPPIIAVVMVPGLNSAVEAEQSYLLLAKMVLPIGMLGVFFFAMLSAAITSLNAEFNVVAQVVVEDVLRPLAPEFVRKHGVLLGRILMALMALVCLLISLAIPLMGGSYKFLVQLMGMTTLPTFMPLLFGLLYRRTPGWGAILAFTLGVGISLVLTFGFGWGITGVVAVNFVVTLATLLISGYIDPVHKEPAIIALFERLKIKGSGELPEQSEPRGGVPACSAPSPMLPVVGWSLLILSGISLLALLEKGGSVLPTVSMVVALLISSGIFLAISSSQKRAWLRYRSLVDGGSPRSSQP